MQNQFNSSVYTHVDIIGNGASISSHPGTRFIKHIDLQNDSSRIPSLTLFDFTITGFDISSEVDNNGGVLYINGNCNLILSSMCFYDNRAASGSVLYANDVSTAVIENSIFDSNLATNLDGGSVYFGASNTDLALNSSDISDNRAYNGGSFYKYSGNTNMNGTCNYSRNLVMNNDGEATHRVSRNTEWMISNNVFHSIFIINLSF
jgi:hypothetical protein